MKFKTLFVRAKRLARNKTVRKVFLAVLKLALRVALKKLLDGALDCIIPEMSKQAARRRERCTHIQRSPLAQLSRKEFPCHKLTDHLPPPMPALLK